jgi:hypothetical protein
MVNEACRYRHGGQPTGVRELTKWFRAGPGCVPTINFGRVAVLGRERNTGGGRSQNYVNVFEQLSYALLKGGAVFQDTPKEIGIHLPVKLEELGDLRSQP